MGGLGGGVLDILSYIFVSDDIKLLSYYHLEI